jgi:hypothetical protein
VPEILVFSCSDWYHIGPKLKLAHEQLLMPLQSSYSTTQWLCGCYNLLRSYLWHGKQAVIKWELLCLPKSEGGLGIAPRLAARRFSEMPGIDCNETFAPVTRHNGIRTLLATATIEDLVIHQLDDTTAYLNGSIEEEIYLDIFQVIHLIRLVVLILCSTRLV